MCFVYVCVVFVCGQLLSRETMLVFVCGQLLSRETMLVFAASCRLIASMTPVLDLLVNLVCFDVYSRTASKTGSPGRSFFSNCLSVHRIDAILFHVSFYVIFASQFGSANWSFVSS